MGLIGVTRFTFFYLFLFLKIPLREIEVKEALIYIYISKKNQNEMDKQPLIVECASVMGATVPTSRALQANGKKIVSRVSKIAHSCTPEQVRRILAAVTCDVLAEAEITVNIDDQPADVLGCALAMHYRKMAEETPADWEARLKSELEEIVDYNLHAARVSVRHDSDKTNDQQQHRDIEQLCDDFHHHQSEEQRSRRVDERKGQQRESQQHQHQHQQYHQLQHQHQHQQDTMDDIFNVQQRTVIPNETAALRDELRELRRQYSEDKALWQKSARNNGGRTAECEELLREVVQMHPQLANASREPIMEEMMATMKRLLQEKEDRAVLTDSDDEESCARSLTRRLNRVERYVVEDRRFLYAPAAARMPQIRLSDCWFMEFHLAKALPRGPSIAAAYDDARLVECQKAIKLAQKMLTVQQTEGATATASRAAQRMYTHAVESYIKTTIMMRCPEARHAALVMFGKELDEAKRKERLKDEAVVKYDDIVQTVVDKWKQNHFSSTAGRNWGPPSGQMYNTWSRPRSASGGNRNRQPGYQQPQQHQHSPQQQQQPQGRVQ
jgi:hypothetical protein